MTRKPTAEQRLEALFHALPPGGAVVLKWEAIGQMLGVAEGESCETCQYAADKRAGMQEAGS